MNDTIVSFKKGGQDFGVDINDKARMDELHSQGYKTEYAGYKPSSVTYNPDGTRILSENEQKVENYYNSLYQSDDDFATKQNETKDDFSSRMQEQIDAVEAAYADTYLRARQDAGNRLGSTAVINAGAGQRGAPSGNANREKTIGYNNQVVAAIDARKGAEIMLIRGKYDDKLDAELKYQETLKKNNAEEWIKYMEGKEGQEDEMKQAKMADIMATNSSFEELEEDLQQEYAELYGYSAGEAKRSWDHKIGSQLETAEQARIAKEREDTRFKWEEEDRKTTEGFTLSEGQKRYDSRGMLVADNPKQAEELTEMERLNIESKKLDIESKIKDLNSTDLDSKTVSQVDKISSSFDSSPIVKNFNEVQNKKLSIDAIVENGVGGPADLALVFEFMKSLDPTSVVRESEYASAAASGNIFLGWAAKFNGYMKEEGGFLPPEVKNEFKRITGDKFDIIKQQYGNLRDEKARLIDQKTKGEDGTDYLIDYDFTSKPTKFKSIQDWVDTSPVEQQHIFDTIEAEDLNEEEALQLINRIGERSNLSKVESDTNKALPEEVAKAGEGENGGQCGRFVNKVTGLGMGDSYESKIAKTDPSIESPEPGMVFVMPYKNTGHTGFVVDVKGDKAVVKDSNWKLDEKVKTHEIPLNKITGYARV